MTDGARYRVLVVLLTAEASTDARVLRQLEFLASRYEVIFASLGTAPMLPSGVRFVELPDVPPGSLRSRVESALRIVMRRLGLYRQAYWRDQRIRGWRRVLNRVPTHVIVANDLFALPLALGVDGDTPVVFDAHEHWTSESASWTRLQRLSMGGSHDWIVERCVPRTAAMMTVSGGIADEYRKRLRVAPSVVTNAPFFQPLKPSRVREPIRLLHVGIADERRRLEDTIEAVRMLDERFSLDLVLMRDNRYRRRLKQMIATNERIRLLPPVGTGELIRFANDYDVGVFLLPARFPNQVHVLPNKLFDYIQARLAVAVGPSREMAAIVTGWDCGVVSEDFSAESFAEALDGLTVGDVGRMKANADAAASVLSAESNRQMVLSLVEHAIIPGAVGPT